MFPTVGATAPITATPNTAVQKWKPTPASSATALATYSLQSAENKSFAYTEDIEQNRDNAPVASTWVNDFITMQPGISFNQGTIFLVATMTDNWADATYRQSLLWQVGNTTFRWMHDYNGYLSWTGILTVSSFPPPLTTPIHGHRFVLAFRNTDNTGSGAMRRIRSNGDGGVALLSDPISNSGSIILSGPRYAPEGDLINAMRSYPCALSDAEMDSVLLELCHQWNIPPARPSTLTVSRWLPPSSVSDLFWWAPTTGLPQATTATGDNVLYWAPFDQTASEDVLHMVDPGLGTISQFTVTHPTQPQNRQTLRGVALSYTGAVAGLRTRYGYGGLNCCVAVSFALIDASRHLGTLVTTHPVDVEAFVVSGQNVANSLTFSRIGLDNNVGGTVTDTFVVSADEMSVLVFQFEVRADGVYLARSVASTAQRSTPPVYTESRMQAWTVGGAITPRWINCSTLEFGGGGGVVIHEVRVYPTALTEAAMNDTVSSMLNTS